MQVKDLNQGDKAVYSLNNSVLTIEVIDQSIELDLAAEQEEESKTIDVCLDKKGNLIKGIANWYVANITIPATTYILVDTGEVDEQGNTKYDQVKDELDLDKVKLDLWGLPNFIKEEETEGGIE